MFRVRQFPQSHVPEHLGPTWWHYFRGYGTLGAQDLAGRYKPLGNMLLVPLLLPDLLGSEELLSRTRAAVRGPAPVAVPSQL